MKKIIKYIAIGFAGLVGLLLIVALFVPKDYAVERSVTINAPCDSVFNYISLLRNQDNFSVWTQMDPETKQTDIGVDGTVGFITTWDSENDEVGQGEQEIMAITPNERLDVQVRFIRPFKAACSAYMTTSSLTENSTKVTWGMSGTIPYPFNLTRLFCNFEEMSGNDLETGLLNLKKLMEQN